jgi:predicted nuclease of restriction endonuclease-like RecB superfamily
LSVCSEDGLKSHLPPPEDFDSTIEETFATQFGPERDGWRLSRESEILHDGQTTFLPDFVFRHDDGRTAFLEIVGFWTPEYLEKKRQTVARFREHNVLLAVPHRSLRPGAEIGPNIIVYKTRLKVEAVLAALGGIKPSV